MVLPAVVGVVVVGVVGVVVVGVVGVVVVGVVGVVVVGVVGVVVVGVVGVVGAVVVEVGLLLAPGERCDESLPAAGVRAAALPLPCATGRSAWCVVTAPALPYVGATVWCTEGYEA